MKKIYLFLILLTSIPVYSASKAKTFTKKYKNERLEVVLNDLCKRNGYTLSVLDEDIDLDKPITAEFKDARTSNVLKKVLDEDVQGKVKKGVMTISRKPVPPVVYMVRGTVPSQEIDNDSINQKTYQDTTFTINCRMITLSDTVASVPQSEPQSAGSGSHHVQVLLGGGYGSMGYSLGDAGKVSGGFGGNVQLRYLYYITENWGVGLGLGFSNYVSTGVLNTTLTYQDKVTKDSENQSYAHSVRANNWTEQQQAYMLDIPLMAQCMYPLNSVSMQHGVLKIYADLGVNMGLCLAAHRQLKSGSVDHLGSYSKWNLELEHIDDHDFYTEQAEDFGTDRQKLDIKLPAVGLMAALGFAIPVTSNLDVMVGLYMNYTLNNVCAETRDLGWRQNLYTGDKAYRNHDYMEYYGGLIGSQFAETLRPWQAGIRVGINWQGGSRKQEQMVEPEIAYRRVNRCDTTYSLQPRVETVVKPKPVVVEKIRRVLEKSVIWFDFNSTDPKLEPADILDKVAEILIESPEQRIMITGHASNEGSRKANQQLSEERAKAIADRLIQLGVRADQIEQQGLGVDVDYMQGQHDISLDRRAEITPITK